MAPVVTITVVNMSNLAVRLRLSLDAARRQWQTDDGGVGIREMVALVAVAVTILAAAVAVLEVGGFDVGEWIREQSGTSSTG